jgi:hypothetical protein
MPVAAGMQYRISGPGMETGSTMNFVALSGPIPDDAEAVAAMLVEHGCTAQLEQLGDYLAEG